MTTPLPTRYSQTHLVEKARIELACDYLVHESRKIFPDITCESAYSRIACLAPDRNSENVKVRNFWNLFCAMSITWRIKDLCPVATAQNFTWVREQVSIVHLVPQTRLGWVKKIDRYDFSNAIAFLRQNDELKKALEESENARRNNPKGDEKDPIIVIREGPLCMVVDGNSRLKWQVERWLADGGQSPLPTLKAWVGQSNGNPWNYWIPTSSIIFLNSIAPQITEELLKRLSPMALAEYRERVKPEPQI